MLAIEKLREHQEDAIALLHYGDMAGALEAVRCANDTATILDEEAQRAFCGKPLRTCGPRTKLAIVDRKAG